MKDVIFKVTILVSLLSHKVFTKQQLTRVIDVERMETIVPWRPDFAYCSVTLDPSPRNRFEKVLNVNMTVVRPIPAKDLYVEAVLWKLSGNVYKRTAFYYKKSFCAFLENELKTFLKHDSSPAFDEFQLSCPSLEQKTFLVKNYTLDTSQFTSVLQMFPLWTVKFLFTLRGCPHSEVYNNGTWGEEGEICYENASYFTFREV